MAEPMELTTAAQRRQAIAVFKGAFVDPVPEPSPRGAVFTSRHFAATAIRMTCSAFGSVADARWYGLAADGFLVSAALLTPAEPQLAFRSYLVLARFGVNLFSMLSWDGIRRLIREVKTWPPGQAAAVAAAFSPRPGFQELHLIATSPVVQARGCGDRLLTFLKAQAAEQGYSGLSLTTWPGSPAYRWYLRHGFVSEVEFTLLDMGVSRMALGFGAGDPQCKLPWPRRGFADGDA